MIKQVKVSNGNNKYIIFDFENPDMYTKWVKSITGIGRYSDSNVATNTILNTFTQSLYSSRTITFTFYPLTDYGIVVNRAHLADVFWPGVPITIQVTWTENGTDTTNTFTAYVQSFDSDIFSKNEEVQITLVCPSPYYT